MLFIIVKYPLDICAVMLKCAIISYASEAKTKLKRIINNMILTMSLNKSIQKWYFIYIYIYIYI